MERIERELKTLRIMIAVFCASGHGTSEPCPDCRELIEYAGRRLKRCRFGKDKPACSACPIHCYRPEMRERIREVMRYAGPRMTFRHPVLAALHFIDRKRRRP